MTRRSGGIVTLALAAGGVAIVGPAVDAPVRQVVAATPSSAVPETTAPKTTAPPTTVPASTMVETTTVPATTVPATTLSATTVPTTTPPATEVPLAPLSPVAGVDGVIVESAVDGPSIRLLGTEIVGAGAVLALSADGNFVAVGWAPETDEPGVVRVYGWSGPDWVQVGPTITAGGAGERFGASVALSADGTRVAVGAPDVGEYQGLVRVYDWDKATASWLPVGGDLPGVDLPDVGSQTGTAVDLSADGSRVAVGSIGSVSVFDWDDAIGWRRAGEVVGPSGRSTSPHIALSMTPDGRHLAVADTASDPEYYSENPVLLYRWDELGRAWVQVGPPTPPQPSGPGKSVALSASAERLVVGGPKFGPPWNASPGEVLVFEPRATGPAWSQAGAALIGDGAESTFGQRVAIAANGGRVAVGSPLDWDTLEGHVRIYDWDNVNASWRQVAVIPGPATLGSSLEFSDDGTRLAVGSSGEREPCLVAGDPCGAISVARVFEVGAPSPTVVWPAGELPATGSAAASAELAGLLAIVGVLLLVVARRRPDVAQRHRRRGNP